MVLSSWEAALVLDDVGLTATVVHLSQVLPEGHLALRRFPALQLHSDPQEDLLVPRLSLGFTEHPESVLFSARNMDYLGAPEAGEQPQPKDHYGIVKTALQSMLSGVPHIALCCLPSPNSGGVKRAIQPLPSQGSHVGEELVQRFRPHGSILGSPGGA